MSVSDIRKDLEEIRASARAGDMDQVVQAVDRALRALDGSRLLTTAEAAELLGIRSVNTLKTLIRQSGAVYELHGNRMMIPVSTLEALQHSQAVRGIRASDQAHDELERELGGEMSAGELRDLSASRPGRLPWQREE